MKRSVLYIMLAIAVFSCKKNDSSVFNASPDQRLNETLKKDQAALVGATYGWKATVTTGFHVPYHFYFKFNDSNRVSMFSDFDTTTASVYRESSYRLKALQQPSLLFDTYNYIHLLADPDAGINGGSYGQGQISDFEFAIDTVTTDSIRLTGRFNSTKVLLLKASEQEADEWANKNWYRAMAINNISKILNYFKRVTLGGVTYEISFFDPLNKTITLTWFDAGGNVHTFTTGYKFSPNPEGIVFDTPLTTGTLVITGFYSIAFNTATSTLNLSTGSTSGSITGAIAPLKVDVAAPRRWWQYAVDNNNDYWISDNGFHVNGVDDAFGVNSLTSGSSSYYYLIYWPKYNAAYDFFGPIFLSGNSLSIVYGTAPKPPAFTADGRAIFTQFGNLGTYPASGPAANSRTQLYSASGYYFVQTSATTYDMVSALDAKTWISWQF